MAVVEPGTGDVPVIEDNIYDVTCIDTEELEMVDKYSDGQKRKKIKVHLQVHGTDDGEGHEIVLDPLLNLKWSSGGNYPASTLYMYAVALCGPQDGDVAFDTDNLKGKKARALIRTEEPGTWPKVKEIMPVGKAGTATQAKAASTSPNLVNFMGEPDWPKFWDAADKLCGDRDKAKAAILPLVNDDLTNLEGMNASTVVDLYEALKEKLAVPF